MQSSELAQVLEHASVLNPANHYPREVKLRSATLYYIKVYVTN